MPSERRSLLVTLIVSCALFMELLDGTVIATALPQIARSFGENAADIGVGISAYLVTLAVFIPISGWTADRIGSRTVFAAAIVVFTLASALCGMSGTLPEFTLARILQGIGGAMMVPVGRLVVFRSTEKRDLIRANALLTTPGLVALVVGPALGGLITTYASWRWIFFLNLPLGIAGLALVLLFMEDGRVELAPRFDPAGFVLSGVGLGLLMFGLDLVGRGDPNALRSAVLIVSGIAVAALSVRHARRVKHPLLDFSLLRIPTFASSVWGGTCVRLVIGTTPFLWGLLFQVGFAMSALGAGLLLLTCAIGDVGSRPFTTRAVRRFGFRAVLTRDALLLAAGILGCAFLSPRTPLVATVALLLFIGVVRSLAFTAINTLAYADVPSERMSAATSLASTLQQLSFGISVAFAAIVLHVAARIHHEQGGVYGIADFRIAFCAVAVIGLAAAYNFAKLAPDAGHVVSGHHGRGGRYAK